MGKILGLDLGTNSIGIAVRNEDIEGKLVDQLEYYSSVVFKSGVGKEKTGEFSFAAQRTEKRLVRRMYQHRKYRIWETLRVLIDYGYCPLTQSEWEQWARYDKSKGLKRQYPVDAKRFEQWVRLDFDNDGKSEYTTPYELRAILATKTLDLSVEENRFAVGRALYHIAQRRGFKSSKGETLKNQEKDSTDIIDISESLIKSEKEKIKAISEYMQMHNLSTIGCAMDALIKEGIRVRDSQYTPVRQQYADEVKIICSQQNLPIEFYNEISKAIFYKRPLKSQKGTIGKCTLEKNKYRCPISHPEFEIFRAWSFINNIKVNKESLSLEIKQDLFNELFIGRVKDSFKFEEITNWLSKKFSCQLSYKTKTINYKENTNVSGCPVVARLKNILGDEWQTAVIYSQSERKGKDKKKGLHQVSYNYQDLWHLCFSCEDARDVEFILDKKGVILTEEQKKQLGKLWSSISQGYSMLSLKAIRLINVFLQKGYIYTDAVLLAKLPEIISEELWCEYGDTIEAALADITNENRFERRVLNIVNSLIAKYKVLDESEQFARFNYEYVLDEHDLKEVERATIDSYGQNKWNELPQSEQKSILLAVESYYQKFFQNKKREYFKLSRLQESLSRWIMKFLAENDIHIEEEQFKQLYHPSQIDFYAPAKEETYKTEDGTLVSKRLLQSPVIGAFKNPMAMRTLHILRQQINKLLKADIIDEDTRVVVETARELNDANMRWAIETYQRNRKEEYEEIRKRVEEVYVNRKITDDDLEKVKLLIDQTDLGHPEIKESREVNYVKGKGVISYDSWMKTQIAKYELWLDQGCKCIYTGKLINITNLFSDNKFDVEHTIPRSISFDDSMANLTICDADFNRRVKKNRKPAELENYDEILVRIQPWINRVEKLKQNIEYYKHRSRIAQTKKQKDDAICQRHLWELELEYWEKKVNTFLMKDVPIGFRNSQLVDTGIITKYAYHFLRSLFSDVSVQKGSVTAAFRKILGLQTEFEKKDRSKHSHHAVDATTLTLIPKSALRDEMLKLFYEREEAKKWSEDANSCQAIDAQLKAKLKSCHIGNIDGLVSTIESNILVRHILKDQTLTPAGRRVRVRGKKVYVVNAKGEEVEKWQNGDIIRGQLHKESWYGVINKDGNYSVVMRNNLVDDLLQGGSYDKLESILEIVIDKSVSENIISTMKQRQQEGLTYNEAIKLPFWMLDKEGNPIKYDKNGRPLLPIRHIRCKVKAGRGFFTKDKALEVKSQTYQSSKKLINLENRDHKQLYYAQNDGNYLCLLYEGINKGKLERTVRLLSYFDLLKYDIKSVDSLWEDNYFNNYHQKKVELKLTAIIKAGTHVLLWKETPDELIELNRDDLVKRLYIVYKFNRRGSSDMIYLKSSIEARKDTDIKDEYTQVKFDEYQAKLSLVSNSFNALIEGRDFVFDDLNRIKFL